MKKHGFAIMICLCFAIAFCTAEGVQAAEKTGDKAPQYASEKEKFDAYRTALKKEYDIDIAGFKEQIKGGRSSGKKITRYPLDQLILGIKVELEHTSDKMKALEISMDHLEEFPDYYTRLLKMEEEAEKAMKK